MTQDKSLRYQALVADRKACTACMTLGLTNPASTRYDGAEIGPWTRWLGDLTAKLLLIGQDWGDVHAFRRQKGLDKTKSATNTLLVELLYHAGLIIDPAPTTRTESGVFFTNAALCLKHGGMQADVKEEWFTNCGKFLRRQIELVGPKVVVTLGERAYHSVAREFGLAILPFRQAVESALPCALFPETVLVPVYHCSARILNSHRHRDAQFNDWLRVKDALAVS